MISGHTRPPFVFAEKLPCVERGGMLNNCSFLEHQESITTSQTLFLPNRSNASELRTLIKTSSFYIPYAVINVHIDLYAYKKLDQGVQVTLYQQSSCHLKKCNKNSPKIQLSSRNSKQLARFQICNIFAHRPPDVMNEMSQSGQCQNFRKHHPIFYNTHILSSLEQRPKVLTSNNMRVISGPAPPDTPIQ